MKHYRASNRNEKAETDSRFSHLLGLLAGLILLAFFIYPAGAYPRQALLLSAIELAAAAGLAGWLLRSAFGNTDGHGPTRTLAASSHFLSAMGSVPALGALGFALWAVARWHCAEVPELEREWIVGLLALAVSLVLGCGVGAVCRSLPPEATARAHGEQATAGPIHVTSGGSDLLTVFRVAALSAIGFGAYAFYQYFVSYPRALAELTAQAGGAVRDLNTQSLIHAFTERRVGGTLGNPNLFAAQLSLFALLSLGAARGPGRAWRWVGAAGAAAALAAAILSRSRGGALTMALGLGLGGIMLLAIHKIPPEGGTPKLPIALVLIFAVLAFLAAGQAWAAHEGLMARLGNISTVRERLYYWQIALKVWARHPWIGEGPGGYQLLYLTLKSPIARESQYAHSWFFQAGSELGLAGLGLLTCFFAGAAGRVWAAWRRGDLHPDAPWCLGALMILAFNGLFEFSLQWHGFLTAAGLMGGLVCGLTGSSGVPPSGGVHSVFGADEAVRGPRKEERTRASALPEISAFIGLAMASVIFILAMLIGPPFYLAGQASWQAELAARDEPPRWAEAAAGYGRAMRWLPASPGLRLAWAGALERLGLDGEAWNQLGEAQRLNPRSAAVRAAQAGWLERQGRREEAIAMLGEALKRYPSHVGYRLERARLALAAGRAEAARADLEDIEKNRLPVWEFQQPDYLKLRRQAGLAPVSDIPS